MTTTATPHFKLRGLLSLLLWEIGPPIAIYYGLRLLGADSYLALLAGALTAGLRIVYVAVRSRRFDGFAAFIASMFAAGLLLSLLTGDERFLLAKDSLQTAFVSAIFIGTCVIGKPLTYHVMRRVADPAAVDAEWAAHPRGYVLSSLAWGFALLAEAVARLPLIYLLPIDLSVGLSKLLGIAVLAGLVLWTGWYAKRS